MRSDPPSVSIIVPTYNQPQLLLRLLDSLEKQAYPGSLEVIVVDDCSGPETAVALERWCAQDLSVPCRYLRLDRNGGPGRARNHGARNASGEVLAFTDSDCVADPKWIASLVAPLDIRAGIAGVGGKVLPLEVSRMTARYYAFHMVLDPPASLQYLVTCNCCYHRQALLSAGGFSEDIGYPGGEDIEASILLWKQGKRFAFSRNAIIHHDFRDSIPGFYKTWWNYGHGTSLVVHRQLSPPELVRWPAPSTLPDFWSVEPVYPTVTGLRSFFIWGRWHLRECNEAHFGTMRTIETLMLWVIERIAYLRGWRAGKARAAASRATHPG